MAWACASAQDLGRGPPAYQGPVAAAKAGPALEGYWQLFADAPTPAVNPSRDWRSGAGAPETRQTGTGENAHQARSVLPLQNYSYSAHTMLPGRMAHYMGQCGGRAVTPATDTLAATFAGYDARYRGGGPSP
jgi:hypothetical protein